MKINCSKNQLNKYIQTYIDFTRGGEYAVCEAQILLCDFVEKCFREEDIYVDDIQLEEYLSYQKYFPYDLFDWEKFLFALHNCTYRSNGELRFPDLFIFVGRGSGKNGYLAFEDFCLLTPTNGIKKYNIDVFATSEKQAKTSWQDVYEVLETHSKKMKKHFTWTKQLIRNRATQSEFAYNTSSYKTKDGYRPGKVDHDEYHNYDNGKLIDVSVSGLGKVQKPRRTIISSDGDVRGGPLDVLKDQSMQILKGEIPDNGLIPFLCYIEDEKEIDNPLMWHKANPSLAFFPVLKTEMSKAYNNYKNDPITYSGFVTKRLNLPLGDKENEVTSWENVKITNRPFIDFKGLPCVAGFDYTKTNDFAGVGLLYKVDDVYYWVSHAFVCRQSADLHRIKAPLDEWAKEGFLTFVEAPEIPPELPVICAVNTAKNNKSFILRAGMDYFRYTWLRNALTDNCFDDKRASDYRKIIMIRPMMEMKNVPLISSAFNSGDIVFGDNPLMRWSVNNTKIVASAKGNLTYEKIEPKSRKNDPFKAFVQAFCAAEDLLDKRKGTTDLSRLPGVRTY